MTLFHSSASRYALRFNRSLLHPLRVPGNNLKETKILFPFCRYSGQSLQSGDCGITFSHASVSDAGDWICHMGPSNQLGPEHTDVVSVRVTGPLAANKKEINVVVGESTTLYCRTSNGVRPLNYCRFLTPYFVGVNIDSSVTSEK